MSTMKVKVSVDELDISSVVVGQKATIKFDALADKTFTGIVESAAQTGTTTDNTTTYDVIVSISNPTGIRLGMNANVTIAVKSKDNAIVIPEEALVESNNKKYVRVQNTTSSDSHQSNNEASSTDSNSKLVEITTGIETEDYIEVTKGVTAGQAVLVQLPSSSSSTTTQRGMGGQGGSMGGQMQRVAIARALVTDPQIILADEPTGALDSKSGNEVLKMLENLNNEGNTIVIITHDRDIDSHAKRVITVRDGHITSDEINNKEVSA